MILTDLHTHSDFSGDCKIPMKEMVSSAINKGITYYAITEHHDIEFPECGIDFTFDIEAYFKYFKEFEQSMPKGFHLLSGMEFGLQTHLNGTLSELNAKYPFDIIVGSCHLAQGIDPYQPEYFEKYDRDEGYRIYFEEILNCVETLDEFDTLGHMDYVIRYWRGEGSNKYSILDFDDVITSILKTLIRRDKALEINTAAYKYKLNQPHPPYDVLTRYHELGGELLTIGSDAHLPKNVATSFEVVEENLKSIGFKSYTTYVERKAIQLGW